MLHLFQFKDRHIVMDVNSGSVHVVDPLVYRILEEYDPQHPERPLGNWSCKVDQAELAEALEEIRTLQQEGMLFTEEDAVSQEILDGRAPVVKALCLHVAHDCNMVCEYCFGDGGHFAGSKCLMSLETGKKAIDMLLTSSGSRINLEIDFFGGEPLMNFEVVKDLVFYGRQQEKLFGKRIRFTMTTNGLLLDEEKAAYLNEHMDNVILSMDGRPEVNDRMRKTVNQKGTYDLILKNYLNFIQSRDGLYYVRGTFTRNNLDFTEDILHLLNLGFRNVSIEPVVTSSDQPYALQRSDLPVIFQEYDRLSDLFLERTRAGENFDFFHFNMDLTQGPCMIKRLSGCGAGTEYMAVSPEGDCYPCHQFVGNQDFKIGSVYQTPIVNDWYETFLNAHIYAKEACQKCWAKYYCSGGCHANAWQQNGDIMIPYDLGCEMEKKRVECAVGIQAVLMEEGVTHDE